MFYINNELGKPESMAAAIVKNCISENIQLAPLTFKEKMDNLKQGIHAVDSEHTDPHFPFYSDSYRNDPSIPSRFLRDDPTTEVQN